MLLIYGNVCFFPVICTFQKKYTDALEEVYQMDKFHGFKPAMQADLRGAKHYRLEHKVSSFL